MGIVHNVWISLYACAAELYRTVRVVQHLQTSDWLPLIYRRTDYRSFLGSAVHRITRYCTYRADRCRLRSTRTHWVYTPQTEPGGLLIVNCYDRSFPSSTRSTDRNLTSLRVINEACALTYIGGATPKLFGVKSGLNVAYVSTHYGQSNPWSCAPLSQDLYFLRLLS